MNHINGLPREMLLQILELLGPKDLKSAVRVCQLWRELGEDPRLWSWAVLTIGTMKDLQKVNIERLRILQEIKVSHKCTHVCLWYDIVECIWLKKSKVNELFKVILKIPTVTRISGLDSCHGVSCVDPQLLVSVINRLEELILWRYLTSEQMELLFTVMAENTNVKALEVSDQPHVSVIIPVVFAAAISNIVEVFLCEDEITLEQMKALFEAICNKDRPLRKLEVNTCLTIDIDPALLGLALNRLEEARTYGPWISAAQINAVIRNLVEGKSRLKKLTVDVWDAAAVEELDADLVQRAKEKVGKFYLVGNEEEGDGGEANEECGDN